MEDRIVRQGERRREMEGSMSSVTRALIRVTILVRNLRQLTLVPISLTLLINCFLSDYSKGIGF